VLHKHHSIIHVGAGLVQFVYGSLSEFIRHRKAFSLLFARFKGRQKKQTDPKYQKYSKKRNFGLCGIENICLKTEFTLYMTKKFLMMMYNLTELCVI